MKITNRTTLGELTVLRAKHGVIQEIFDFDFEMLKPVLVVLLTHEFKARGRGDSEAEALDDAFTRLEHRIGVEIWSAHVLADPSALPTEIEGRTLKLFPSNWAHPGAAFEIVDTPENVRCVGCRWRIVQGESGALVPYRQPSEMPGKVVEMPWHRECFLRTLQT